MYNRYIDDIQWFETLKAVKYDAICTFLIFDKLYVSSISLINRVGKI